MAVGTFGSASAIRVYKSGTLVNIKLTDTPTVAGSYTLRRQVRRRLHDRRGNSEPEGIRRLDPDRADGQHWRHHVHLRAHRPCHRSPRRDIHEPGRLDLRASVRQQDADSA